MSSVVLVSGPPGSGKTTIGRALAESCAKGLHLVSDRFYEFIPRLIDPSTSASRDQNHTIMTALGACTAQFASGGYDVFVDGVIGPWMLPKLKPFLEESAATQYVILQVSLAEAFARVRTRQGSGLSPTVRHMNAQFSDLGPFARFAVDTSKRPPQELARTISARLARNEFELDWALIAD